LEPLLSAFSRLSQRTGLAFFRHFAIRGCFRLVLKIGLHKDLSDSIKRRISLDNPVRWHPFLANSCADLPDSHGLGGR
jgi:hypothetical protein